MAATFGDLTRFFREHFGSLRNAIGVRSPGRVNLIGEHTDYNEGFVLPAAVDKSVTFIIAPCTDGAGARMMGAGFGGCTINLVEQRHVSACADEIKEQYRRRTGKANNVYVTQIQTGTELVPLG